MKQRRCAWVFPLLILSGYFSGVFSADLSFYMSPTGNDNNDGATPATPWNTLEKARD